MTYSLDLTVLVPFYNEESYLNESVERLIKEVDCFEIILINDCSTDTSKKIAERLVKNNKNINLINLNKNQGKGNAIKVALEQVNSNYVIVHDADLEYNPSDIFNMFQLVEQNSDSLILGSRTIGNIERIKHYKFTYLGNKYITILFSLLNNYQISDIATCYWLIKTSYLKDMNLKEKGFGIEVEVLSKFLRLNKEIIEVPINYEGRKYDEGKKIRLLDGINILFKVFKYSKLINFFVKN
tara:strand:- start:556 stop:1275 length:720 start_codon:yes stop_codon:yes gene_type:complete